MLQNGGIVLIKDCIPQLCLMTRDLLEYAREARRTVTLPLPKQEAQRRTSPICSRIDQKKIVLTLQ